MFVDIMGGPEIKFHYTVIVLYNTSKTPYIYILTFLGFRVIILCTKCFVLISNFLRNSLTMSSIKQYIPLDRKTCNKILVFLSFQQTMYAYNAGIVVPQESK